MFIYSFIHLFIYSFIYLLIYSFTYLFICLFFIQLNTSLKDSLADEIRTKYKGPADTTDVFSMVVNMLSYSVRTLVCLYVCLCVYLGRVFHGGQHVVLLCTYPCMSVRVSVCVSRTCFPWWSTCCLTLYVHLYVCTCVCVCISDVYFMLVNMTQYVRTLVCLYVCLCVCLGRVFHGGQHVVLLCTYTCMSVRVSVCVSRTCFPWWSTCCLTLYVHLYVCTCVCVCISDVYFMLVNMT